MEHRIPCTHFLAGVVLLEQVFRDALHVAVGYPDRLDKTPENHHNNSSTSGKKFCHSDGIRLLAKYHLKILLNHVYQSLTEMIADIYPQYFEQLVIYQYKRDKRHEGEKRSKRNGPK